MYFLYLVFMFLESLLYCLESLLNFYFLKKTFTSNLIFLVSLCICIVFYGFPPLKKCTFIYFFLILKPFFTVYKYYRFLVGCMSVILTDFRPLFFRSLEVFINFDFKSFYKYYKFFFFLNFGV